ncbi:MAG: hypothetical protein DRG50_09155 [Deltaproteobacteria bacterium]|nr:MAG: hypothetical protein DRG50_09155 [Deltaproteobacteria bacterium]
MIKAVIFDWGGVLIDNPAPGLIAYFASSLGVTGEAINIAYGKFAPEFQKGLISEEILWERICSELGVRKPYSPSLWTDAFREVYSPKEEMFTLASRLREKGYKVGLLSNTEVAAMNYFYEQGYDMFDATVFSCAVGARKPERRIYEITLGRLGVQPEEAIFIDDRVDFIEGAEKVGINVILFKNPEQVRKELASFSIKIT